MACFFLSPWNSFIFCVYYCDCGAIILYWVYVTFYEQFWLKPLYKKEKTKYWCVCFISITLLLKSNMSEVSIEGLNFIAYRTWYNLKKSS